MFVLATNITIGDFNFSRAVSIEMEQSVEVITQKAKIKVPVTAVLKDEKSTTTVEVAKNIKVGDSVLMDIYYNGYVAHAKSFQGVVTQINPKSPLEIEVEDASWYLRQKNVNKSWKATTLTEIINEIVKGTNLKPQYNLEEINVSPYYLKNKTGLSALQKVKDDFGLSIYVKNGYQLYVGYGNTKSDDVVKLLINGKDSNVISADNLKWRKAEDSKVKVKAIYVKPDNSRVSEETGDEDGALRTLYFYNVSDSSALKKLAKQELEKLKFDGYEGNLKTFLLPAANPGMTAEITDERFPDRGGTYFINSVKSSFSGSGGRQEIEVGIKFDK